ncbi:MAG: radical SAM protein [Oligoflexia bacterium]|nr:radical SAM protein [Oligoflexia bacterium]
MKILLIYPPNKKSIVADMSDYFEDASGAYPPLGIMYIASYLIKNNIDKQHDIRMIDASCIDHPYENIIAVVEEFEPDLVGITALTFNILDVLHILKDIKKSKKSILTVVGGPHPSIFPNETLVFSEVDFIVQGEGEIAFSKIVSALENNSGFSDIPGLGYKVTNSTVNINNQNQLIENLDLIPFPAVELLPNFIHLYKDVLSTKQKLRSTIIISSRGCPFGCIYCDRPQMGKKFRARSAKNVVDEVEKYLTIFAIGHIKFFDDTFTVDKKRVYQICEEIKSRQLEFAWGIRAHVNTVDFPLLKAMYECGLKTISFGIESSDNEILKNLNKGSTVEGIERAVSFCKKLGIKVLGDFILGNPGESKKHILNTIKFAKRLRLDYAQFTIMTPYPHTKLYTDGLQKGIIKHDYWKNFAINPSSDFVTPVWEENLSKAELVDLLKKAYRDFYFRPRYLLKRVSELRSITDLLSKIKVFFLLFKLIFSSARKLSVNFKKGLQTRSI